MQVTRRQLLAVGSVSLISQGGQAKSLAGLKIGVTDWNLKLSSKVEAIGLASELGFAGVEVSLGGKPVGDRLPLGDPEVQDRYLSELRRQKMEVAGTCLNILHRNYLKNDKLGQKWLAQGIPITEKLQGRVMLLPFFGKGALTTRTEMDYVGDVLRELAPEAERAGVVLGLENTISAENNVRIMERSRSAAVSTYYDVGNSTRAGFDIIREIGWLGRERICQFHLKDNPHYMGEGTINFNAVTEAIASLDFEGFANLETQSPSKSVEDDMRRNLSYIRRLIGKSRS